LLDSALAQEEAVLADARRSLPPRALASRCAFGLSSGDLLGCLVVVGAGTLRLSLDVLCAGLLRSGRVLPGLGSPGLGLGGPGLRGGYRIVSLLPRRGHLLLRGLSCGRRFLFGGRRRPHRLGQPRLGSLGTGLKPSLGFLCCRDLRFESGPQLGLVPRGLLADLRYLLLRGPADLVQLRAGRFGRFGLRGGHRIVSFPPRRGHLLLCGPLGLGDPRLRRQVRGRRLLFGGRCRRYRLGPPRLGLGRSRARLSGLRLGPLGTGLKPSLGFLCCRDLRFESGPQLGLVPRGLLADLRYLLLRGPADLVQLRAGRFGRFPRPGRIPPGIRRRRYRLGPPRLGLHCRGTRLPGLRLSPLAAPPEREPRRVGNFLSGLGHLHTPFGLTITA
jgi:hypothetical protein